MALSGLDIYKLLPKTNCRKCGFATCLAFAMQLAKKAVSIDKCPYLSAEAKQLLEASSQPPIKLVTIGTGENRVEVGNETVMFRHEEKFHHPTALGFIIEDTLSAKEIEEKVKNINQLKFERVGQKLEVNLIAIRQNAGKEKFIQAVKLISGISDLGLVLMSDDLAALKAGMDLVKARKPLIFHATKENLSGFAALAKEYAVPLVVTAADLETVSSMTKELNN
ncbi:MAG: (Fe-S)-binding protein, partial [Candidatus Omnitrophica bacterium]|nr:(Fe-S)-binding protein [Candidatus Omnitrophota bacterium]